MNKSIKIYLKELLLVFMIIQPFFDSYILYSDEVIDFFGFSPTTILRILFVGFLGVFCFFDKDNKKTRKPLTIYGLLFLIYTIIHHIIGASIDDNLIYSSLRYSLLEELFYLVRLLIPFVVAYVVYCYKLTKEQLKSVIIGTSINLSLIIIILNLANISLTSYFDGYIKGNIFSWFNSDISRYALASKGWFNSANQIGGLLLILVPMMIYYVFSELKISDLIVLLLLILSSYALGTRTSCIGASLVMIALFVLFYFYKIIGKQKINRKEIIFSIILIIFSLTTFNYAPIVNCSGNNISCILNLEQAITDPSTKDVELKNPDYDGSYVCEFLELTSTASKYYEELYPCGDNLDFWQNYVEKRIYSSVDNRIMEDIITNDIYKKINNLPINLFGMSRSRFLSAEIYLEKDIIVHYYTIGIVGIILLISPYFLITFYIGIKKFISRKLSYYDFCLISSILLPIIISIKSGHILDELIVIMYIGFLLGYIIYNYQKINSGQLLNQSIEHSDKKNILFVVDERKMGGVSILLKDILEIFDYKKYKIDVLVLHNNGECLNDINKNVNLIYGTKFFETVDYNLKDLIKNRKISLIIKKIYLVLLMKSGLIKEKIKKERKKIFNNDNYDIEIAFKDGFTAIFTMYGPSKKKIHWLHYEYKKYNSNGNYPKLFNDILPKFDKIVAVSKGVMDDFNEIYHLEDKTIVIENLIDTNRIKEKSKDNVSRKLKKDKINIVCVGRLHKQKGYDRLIRSVNRLEKKEQDKINIEIYGDGLEKESLKDMINKYNLKNINLKGKVENPYKYIIDNDLFILPSIYEPFGLVIVESMILKVPVLACKNSATGKLINNKNNGYIVENSEEGLYSGLKFLINNPDELKKYKKNLKKYKYDNDKIINQIKDLLN